MGAPGPGASIHVNSSALVVDTTNLHANDPLSPLVLPILGGRGRIQNYISMVTTNYCTEFEFGCRVKYNLPVLLLPTPDHAPCQT